MGDKKFPTASLTISFTSEAIGLDADEFVLKGEVKSEDNNDRTSFLFEGASPIFRVYKSSNIGVVHKFPTDGSISNASPSQGTETITEIVIFQNSDTASVSYPIKPGTLSAVQLGNKNLGVISQNGHDGIRCSKQSEGDLDPIIGVYRVTYKSDYTKHQLNGVSEPAGFGEDDFDSYPVHIHLVGVPK